VLKNELRLIPVYHTERKPELFLFGKHISDFRHDSFFAKAHPAELISKQALPENIDEGKC
jgi:hypothetical protein